MGIFGKFLKPDIEKMKRNRDVQGLVRALKYKDSGVRAAAILALGEMGEPAVIPLIEALKDKDRYVQGGAAVALGKIGKPAVELLVRALKDKKWDVLAGAVAVLGEMGDTSATEPLIRALRDEGYFKAKKSQE